jgi:hypothetical protein
LTQTGQALTALGIAADRTLPRAGCRLAGQEVANKSKGHVQMAAHPVPFRSYISLITKENKLATQLHF